ncbi:MAG: Smr/MutS family protein [Alphaproteobacteria bacterium]|nr:Smr/MutS family protein [Alphaproteobacteria bacterium]
MRIGRVLSHEELVIWQQVTRDIRRLANQGDAAPEFHQETPQVKPKAENALPFPSSPERKTHRTGRTVPSLLESGDTTGMDRRNADRFRRGKMPIDARIDLHGMTKPEAYQALHYFIEVAAHRGLRSVLVITGKGVRGGDSGIGILRAAVPQWLNEFHIRDKILSFTYATPRHGGEGAIYLLLKRQRSN